MNKNPNTPDHSEKEHRVFDALDAKAEYFLLINVNPLTIETMRASLNNSLVQVGTDRIPLYRVIAPSADFVDRCLSSNPIDLIQKKIGYAARAVLPAGTRVGIYAHELGIDIASAMRNALIATKDVQWNIDSGSENGATGQICVEIIPTQSLPGGFQYVLRNYQLTQAGVRAWTSLAFATEERNAENSFYPVDIVSLEMEFDIAQSIVKSAASRFGISAPKEEVSA